MPWLALPETMMTGSSQPFMQASDPAAAQARACVAGSSGFLARRIFPIVAPQLSLGAVAVDLPIKERLGFHKRHDACSFDKFRN